MSDGMVGARGWERPRLRVAFLLGHLHRGGMQRAVSNLTQALPAEWDQIVAFFGTDEPPFVYRARMRDLALPGRLSAGPARKLTTFARRCARLRAMIVREDVDVVISFGEVANVINCLVPAPRRVVSVRSFPSELLRHIGGGYGRIYAALIRTLYRRADRVVAVSEGIARTLVADYGVPEALVEVIPNLYNLEAIRDAAAIPPAAEHVSVFDGGPVMVGVGSLAPHKGFQYLVRALGRARREIPDLRLVLVGDGEARGALEQLARDHGVHDAVHLVGYQVNPHQFIARALVFVLPSEYEGFPNVLVEAMACGTPVIATDCQSGPREILGNSEHGMLIPDPRRAPAAAVEEAIARAVVRLAREPETRAAASAAARARAETYGASAVVERWVVACGST